MSKSIVISIDAMGGDHGPSVVVPGVAKAAQALPGVRFLLHGDEARLNAELAKSPAARAVSEVRHTDKSIAMDEKPAQAMRRGKGSSLWNAVESLRAGEAQACVSAGNTGALMAISKLILRMGAELERPAIVASWPTMKGITAVLDVGANVESDAAQLVEFAIMGAAFHHAVHGSKRPTVGLLNVGSEDQKGHEEVREAHAILKETQLDFDYRGFVEGTDIAYGTVDVVVTDGFVGNVVLKLSEGLVEAFTTMLKNEIMASVPAKIGYMLSKGAFRNLKKKIDYAEYGGAPLLGVEGNCIISHGRSNARAMRNAILRAHEYAKSKANIHLSEEIEKNKDLAAREAASGS